MQLKGAQILIETLIEQGVDTIFGYPGGTVLDIYDALYENRGRIKHIRTAHEQGAAHAADGYARASGKIGVCFATSGPGATNLVTGIANAYLDSVPLLAITGNVSSALIGRDSFQEVDIVGVTMPIVKHSFLCKDVSKLADVVREAIKIALSGRPGPVLIDIPKDVQQKKAEFKNKPKVEILKNKNVCVDEIDAAVKMIDESNRPYIYIGGGASSSKACKDIMALAEKIDAPIGSSMMGLSSVPTDYFKSLGMAGMHGHYASTKAMYESDLIIAVGVRFSDRATGDKSKFSKHKKVLHIDIDPAEISKNIFADLGIAGDLKVIVDAILSKVNKSEKPDWEKQIEEFKKYENENTYSSLGELSPYDIIDAVNARADEDTPFATDVGQHQMWAAQRCNLKKSRKFISSGGLGTMGFGMGAAIGASVATGKRTVLYTGDGCFGMNLNELATDVANKLPIIILIFNNGVLGMVRQWQTLFYNENYSETTLSGTADFVKLAQAFGAKGFRVDNKESLNKVLDEAFAYGGTTVIDCVLDKDEMVLPMIPAGKSIEDIYMSISN